MKIQKRLLAVFLIFSVALCLMAPIVQKTVHAAVRGYVRQDVVSVNFRETPNGNLLTDISGEKIRLNGGHELTILDMSNNAWYKVSAVYNGQRYVGYISAQYVTVTDEKVADEKPDIDKTEKYEQGDFEDSLAAQNFPESYKVLLRDIHALHPSWQFVAIHTGIEWETLISKEANRQGQIKNLIWTSTNSPHYNWRSTSVGYDWATDKWSPYDGKVWFAASDELVTYYLDPRTYLYEQFVFVFESLSYQCNVQNVEGVEAILKGSFMANTIPEGETMTYAQMIMDAAAQSGVSPYHLAARIRQEMGDTPGAAASGKTQGYEGIYNFYNIGAVDTPNGSPVLKGLEWAATEGSYGRPWNSVYKSIVGGAQYIGTSYISVGQDTLYTQKFNVTNKACLFSHQYMTNVQAPATEAPKAYQAYINNQMIDSDMVFKIPVYLNMPEKSSTKPADSGNPNNWLKSLEISGYSLTPSFTVSETTEYSLIVPEDLSSIQISAETVNSNAKISGTGTVNLQPGTNTIYITVTAQNGNQRSYKLTVVRGDAGGDNIINDPSAGAKKGDLNGDGIISAVDIVKLQRLIVGLDPQDDNILFLGDINCDGIISAIDIVKLQRHIVGLEIIE